MGQGKKSFSSPPALFLEGCLPFLLFVIEKVGLNKSHYFQHCYPKINILTATDSKLSLGEG